MPFMIHFRRYTYKTIIHVYYIVCINLVMYFVSRLGVSTIDKTILSLYHTRYFARLDLSIICASKVSIKQKIDMIFVEARRVFSV